MVPPDSVIGGAFLCRNPSFSFNYSVSEQFIIIVGDPLALSWGRPCFEVRKSSGQVTQSAGRREGLA